MIEIERSVGSSCHVPTFYMLYNLQLGLASHLVGRLWDAVHKYCRGFENVEFDEMRTAEACALNCLHRDQDGMPFAVAPEGKIVFLFG